MLTRDRLYIGGDWVGASSDEVIDVVCPATEEVIGRAPVALAADVDRAVASARAAFDTGPWPRMTPAERASALLAIADGLERRRTECAELITAQIGAPLQFALAAHVPDGLVRHVAGLVAGYRLEEGRRGAFGDGLVCQEPVGVVAAIVPWNAALGLAMGKLAPALGVGCTVVLKAPLESPLDCYLLAEVVDEVGLPPGVLSIIPGGMAAGDRLVTHEDVDCVSFTGSTAVGRAIMASAAATLKRVRLELGGKSASIILDDAPLEAAVDGTLPASFLNNGEACIALTRMLVPEARYDDAVDAVRNRVAQLVVGDPMDPATHIGPLVSRRHRERVDGYIRSGREEGAVVVTGGGHPAGLPRGWYVEPTVFANATNAMRIAREEIFGPVLTIIPYRDDADAVRLANDSPYGLSGAVWSADEQRGLDVARQVRTGTLTVNGFAFDHGLPFGGFKQSGLGREWGREGLESFLETKTIVVQHGLDGQLARASA